MGAWQGDGYQRVVDRVRERGYRSATEFVEAQPTADTIDLARALGEGIATAQLQKVMQEEAGDDPVAIEKLARGTLARTIVGVMPHGWRDEDLSLVGASFYGNLGERYEVATDLVFDALCALAPKGWRPTGPDDPLLLEAFKRWPADPLKPWKGDWRTRVTERAREHGYPSATAFVEAHPTGSFKDLAELLGADDVAAIQVQDVMREEAGADPRAFERLVRNLIVRDPYLAISSDWDAADAMIHSAIADYLGEDHESALERVFEVLATRAPKGWRPTGPDDPLLVEAFRRWGA